MFTSEFAIRFMIDINSEVSAKALLKFWIAVSVSAFMCSPPSRAPGSMSPSSGVSKPSSGDTESQDSRTPRRYVENATSSDAFRASHHRLSSSAFGARFTLTLSCAPHTRISVTLTSVPRIRRCDVGDRTMRGPAVAGVAPGARLA